MFRKDSVLTVGGAQATSWLTIALYAIPSLWATLLYDLPRLGGNFWSWFGFSILLYAATVLPLVVARVTYLRSSETMFSLLLLFLTYGIGSILRASMFVLVGVPVGLVPASELTYRFSSSPLHVVVWMVLITTLVAAMQRHRSAMKLHTDRRAELLLNKLRLDEVLEKDSLSAHARVLEALTPSMNQLRASFERGSAAEQVQKLPEQLLNVIETVVRPLAQELSALAEGSDIPRLPRQKYRFRLQEKVSVKQLNAHGMIALVLSFSLVIPIVHVYGWGLFWTVAAPTVAVTWLGGVVMNRVLGVWKVSEYGALAVMVLAYGLFALASVSLFGTQHSEIPSSLNRLYIGVALLVSLLVGLFRLFVLGQLQLEQEAQAQNDELALAEAKVRQQLWVARNRLATTLHGPVQAAFQVAAMRIAATSKPDVKLLEEVELSLQTALAEISEPITISGELFFETCRELKNLWAGVCEVSFEFEDNIASAVEEFPSSIRSALEVFRESISNAVKHGRATRVEVRAAIHEPFMELFVTNNGLPLPDSIAPNFGLAMIEEVSYRWDFKTINGDTELYVILPLG